MSRSSSSRSRATAPLASRARRAAVLTLACASAALAAAAPAQAVATTTTTFAAACSFPGVGDQSISVSAIVGTDPARQGMPASTPIELNIAGLGPAMTATNIPKVLVRGATVKMTVAQAAARDSFSTYLPGAAPDATPSPVTPGLAVKVAGSSVPVTFPTTTGQGTFAIDAFTLVIEATKDDGTPIVFPVPGGIIDPTAVSFEVPCHPVTGAPAPVASVGVDPGLVPITPDLAANAPSLWESSWDSATIAWVQASPRFPAFVNYTILLDGQPVGATLVSNRTIWNLTDLTPGKTYSVVIKAVGLGQESTSTALTFTTKPLTAPVPPSISLMVSRIGDAAGGNVVYISGDRHSGTITSVLFGSTPAQILRQDATTVVVVAPPGVPGAVVRVSLVGTSGTSADTPASDYRYFSNGGQTNGYHYDVVGSSTVKRLVTGGMALVGSTDLRLSAEGGGAVVGDLRFAPTNANLLAFGFLSVTATVNFVPTAPLTGVMTATKLTAIAKMRIKLPSIKVFGLRIGGGTNCQATQVSTIPLASTAFDPLVGGTLAGTYSISNLSGCGALTGVVSPLTAGSGNNIALKLTGGPAVL